MSEARHIHIIGAGMAGLSAALQLTLMGEKVTIYEAAPHAGGRCRSYYDRELDCRIDNGNHLVLSGNVAIQDYLGLTHALGTMTSPSTPLFPFMDLETGERWALRLSQGRLPWWIFQPARRVPSTKPKDYLSVLRIMNAGEEDTVAACLKTNNDFYRRFWEPMVIAALNTEPEKASALLLKNLFAQSFGAGGKSCLPMIPKLGLSESFVEP
ncbi:MAG: NAD(P)-binding protein, partial [Alphaproteobacteria bacterium]|nr:NAD(P)-binding protein [Alphaproteobacteria bacterium]